jgi:uncharacterized membrane protein YkoI
MGRAGWSVLLASLVAPAVLAAAPAYLPTQAAAASSVDHGQDPTQRFPSRTLGSGSISLDEAVDMAQRRFNARVVRAEVSESDGRRVYVLRLLSSDGRVWSVRVDAQSGSMQ